jgi:hypothetical protein
MSEGNHLLLLTDQQRERYQLLGQPFAEATVVELAADDATYGHIAKLAASDDICGASREAYAAVLVDRRRLDLQWLAGLLQDVGGLCGRVLVALDAEGELVRHGTVRFDAAAWGGLEVVNGRVCAVLHAAGATAESPAGDLTELLVTAHAAVRLSARATAEDGTMVGIQDAQRVLARQVEETYHGKRALMAELERVTAERDRLQKTAYAKLRRVVGRSWLGRGLRAVRR